MSNTHSRIFFYVSESGKGKTPLIALCALEPASARCATCK